MQRDEKIEKMERKGRSTKVKMTPSAGKSVYCSNLNYSFK